MRSGMDLLHRRGHIYEAVVGRLQVVLARRRQRWELDRSSRVLYLDAVSVTDGGHGSY
jgi:hypothetical protein